MKRRQDSPDQDSPTWKDAEGRWILAKQDFFKRKPIDPESCAPLGELYAMTGLEDVKRTVRGLVQLAADNIVAEDEGQPEIELSLHRVFLGNPGTGKTTVAKVYGKILNEMGFLSSGEVMVVGASTLTGAHVGSTAAKVNAVIDSCAGKVLVIDEAYILGQSAYGKEALDTLVERVQGTGTEDFAVIMCGYEDPMRTMFRECNPGLARRFKLDGDSPIKFQDYDDAQLTAIMLARAAGTGLSLDADLAHAAVSRILSKLRAKPNFGNAGAVNNMLDNAKAGGLLTTGTRPMLNPRNI